MMPKKKCNDTTCCLGIGLQWLIILSVYILSDSVYRTISPTVIYAIPILYMCPIYALITLSSTSIINLVHPVHPILSIHRYPFYQICPILEEVSRTSSTCTSFKFKWKQVYPFIDTSCCLSCLTNDYILYIYWIHRSIYLQICRKNLSIYTMSIRIYLELASLTYLLIHVNHVYVPQTKIFRLS